jgi:hypothetical protein
MLQPINLHSGNSLLSDAQGAHRADGHTHAAAGTAVGVDPGVALVFGADGLVVTASIAGHTDHVIPGDAGIPVQPGLAKWGVDRFIDLDLHGAGRDTGPAEGAAGISKIEVGCAGQFMVSRVQPDDVRLTGCHTWMRAVRACFIQRQTTVPGWRWTQRLLPYCFCGTAFAGQ